MKIAQTLLVLSTLAVLGTGLAAGCGGDDGADGQDVGVGRARVSITADKVSVNPGEKITLTATAKDGTKVAAEGSKISLSTDFGAFDDAGSKTVEVAVKGAKGQAQATITSDGPGTATVSADYSNAATAKITLTFLPPVPDAGPGPDVPAPDPCQITLAAKNGVAQPKIEADGESTLELVAEATWTNGAPVPNATEVEFVTTDGTFSNPQTDPKKFKAYTVNGKASAILVSSTNVNPGVMVTAQFTCGGGGEDASTGVTVVSEPLPVEFSTPIPRPRIFLVSDNMFVLANGIDKAVITATLQTSDPLTVKVPVDTPVKFTTTIGTLTGGAKTAEVKTDANEKTTVEFYAGFDIGPVKITAEATIETKKVTADIELEAIQSGSVTCFSVSSNNIGLKGSGHVDNTTVVFKVQDNQQNPMPRLPIDFTISNAPGGVYIVPTSTRTDDAGVAQTILYSGTVPTTVTVTAATKVGEASCAPIVISTGIPNARFLNFSCKADMINVGGFVLDLIEQPCTVALADRFSNKIPFATKVFFQTEAGAINSSAQTLETEEGLGTATVSVRTSDPRPKDVDPIPGIEPFFAPADRTYNPRDGLLTVIVATTGEEEFDDENGNGQFDDGESFVDIGEPFVDKNDNDTWESDEGFIDWNQNGQYDGPNGAWDGNAVIWKPTWLMWTGDVARGGDCDNWENTYSALCWDEFDIANGGSMDFWFSVKDFNLNPINTTGTVSVKVEGPAKIIGTTEFNILPMMGMGITTVRTPDALNPKIIHETHEFGPFSSGYVNGFLLTDDDALKNEPKPAYVTAKVEYDYDPSKASASKVSTDLWATGLMDSTTTTGKCGVELALDPKLPVPADGVAFVTITAKPRGFDGQPMPDLTTITWVTDGGVFSGSGSKYFVNTTSAGEAKAVLTNVEAGGTVNITASFECNDKNQRVYQDAVQVVFMPIMLSIETENGKTTLLADGQDSVRVRTTVTDSSKHAVTDGTVIRYTTTLGKFSDAQSNCVNTLADSTTCDVAVGAGVAEAVLVGGYVIGTAKVEASLLGSIPLNWASIDLHVIQLGKIEFVNFSLEPLGVKYSGYQESIEVTFKVTDNNDDPLPGQRIDFSFTGAQSGMSAVSVNPAFVSAGADGLAKTTVSSGTLAGSVRVMAKGVMGSQIVTAFSDPIQIVGAKASRKFMSLRCDWENVGGFGSSTMDVNCLVQPFDRFLNAIGLAQPVMFQSEAGYMIPVVNVDPVEGMAAGFLITIQQKMPADVAPLVGEPSYTAGAVTYNPRDGLVAIMAAMRGEEEFDDINGNGVYDAGEKFVDQGEPFVDANDDNRCDPDPGAANMVEYNAGRAYLCIEDYIDTNGSGKFDPPDGVWNADAWIWQGTLMLWTGTMAKSGDCAGPGPNQSIICPPSFTLADGGSQHITYEIKDARLNLLPASANVDISAPDVTLIGKTSFNIEDGLGMDAKRTRTCNAQGRCLESLSLSGFMGGFQGSFDVADTSLGDSGTIKNINVVVDVNYSFDPDSGELDQHDNLISQGALNDPNAVGPCAFKIEADPPSAIANGRDTVQILITGVRDQSGGIVPSGTAVQVESDHGTFSNGRENIVVLTDANGDATTGLLVGNEPGIATIQASFNCNGTYPSRQVQVVLLDPAQIGKASISLVAGAAKVLANGTDTVEINGFAFQANGQPAPDGTPISFATSASTFVQSGTGAAIALTTNGMATVDLKGGTSAGLARITGDYDPDGVPNNGDEVQGKVEVQLITLGSIQFLSVNPNVLGVKHSGYNESAAIQFKVLDNNSEPFPEKQEVNFTLSSSPGGVSLIAYKSYTDLDGKVSTVIISGTVATTVTVTARATMGSTTVTGVTDVIPIIGAKPSAKYIQLSAPMTFDKTRVALAVNFDEQVIDQKENVEYVFTTFLGDRYSNFVERPTTIHFRSEGGTITPQVVSDDSKGDARIRKINPPPLDVAPVVGEPSYTASGHTYNPRDGLVTAITVTTGEEEFDDNNGDGDFTRSDYFRDQDGNSLLTAGDDVCKAVNINPDTGECSAWVAYNGSNFSKSEPFVDLPEPYVDANDNWLCDPGEPFFDTNLDGYCGDAGGNTGNNEWDSNTNIWAEGYQVWTYAYNNIEFGPQGACAGGVPGPNSMNIICPSGAFALLNGGSQTFTANLCDFNFNALFSERESGIFGLWTTSPGIYVTDAEGGVVLKPVTTISNEEAFPLESVASAIVRWVKQSPVDVQLNARINGVLQPTIYKVNQVKRLAKTVQAPGACKLSDTSLDDADPLTTFAPPAPTYIKLQIVDAESDGNVLETIGTISGTAE
ncbi:MAG: hypothetical protein HY897_11985 [Deltaproteobacteria bacterium]|nr:hypothetical protein [Deltaproteobacteria bacterium]